MHLVTFPMNLRRYIQSHEFKQKISSFIWYSLYDKARDQGSAARRARVRSCRAKPSAVLRLRAVLPTPARDGSSFNGKTYTSSKDPYLHLSLSVLIATYQLEKLCLYDLHLLKN